MVTLFGRPLDAALEGRLILAVQRVVADKFGQVEWDEFGYETGEHDYIHRHPRLLRSLSWGDDDYGHCVFQVIRHLIANNPAALEVLIRREEILDGLKKQSPDVLAGIGLASDLVPPPYLPGLTAPQVVERALADVDQLLRTSGPISCIDRVHTALHGYLGFLCEEGNVTVPEDATLTQLFKALRTGHPKFTELGNHDKDAGRTLSGLATVLDALTTLRNHASVAHPNKNLVGIAEAMLMVNSARTVFHYLQTKREGV